MKSQKYGCYTRGPSAFSIVGTQRHCQRYSAWFLFMISCVLMMGDVNSYQLVTKNTEPSQKEAKRLGLNKQCSLQTCCCPFSANIWSLTKKKSFLRHYLAICYANLQCVKGSSHQRNHSTVTTWCFLFWLLKGTCWVWRREPLIYFRHFSLADSNLKDKEQARSLICLLGMPGSHRSPYWGHLFRSQPLQTHTERWCQKGCAPVLLTSHLSKPEDPGWETHPPCFSLSSQVQSNHWCGMKQLFLSLFANKCSVDLNISGVILSHRHVGR